MKFSTKSPYVQKESGVKMPTKRKLTLLQKKQIKYFTGYLSAKRKAIKKKKAEDWE